jgi:non-canonical poly(A) RNA polymerase PAPD5/7
MKPPHTRLTCRAHDRYCPSLVLWQCFIGIDRPFPHHLRLSSTATDSTQYGAGRDNGPPNAAAASERLQSEAKAATAEGIQPAATQKLKITRLKTDKGTWHSSKASASGAKNVQKLYYERMASLTEPEKLLATARTAFEEARDYVGEVVQPMVSSVPCKESKLPWCFSKQEVTMSGIDRLGVEIERFYDFAKPSHLETLARRHVIEQVRDHVRKILPNHILEVFGSERTGLALATSDIDFRLMVKERLENPTIAKLPPTPEQRIEGMTSLHKLHWGGLFKNKAYMLPNLRYARYPLISLQDRNSGLDIQIVLSNDTSISRDYIKKYTEEYPYLRQLYVVVKTMFDVRGLSDVYRGGFGSYSLFMMLVASLKHSPHPRNDAAGGLINFLKFYRSFETAKWGISIEPVLLFDKQENPVLTDRVRVKLAVGTTDHHRLILS